MHYSIYKSALLNSMAEHFLYEKYCWANWKHYKLGFFSCLNYLKKGKLHNFIQCCSFFFSLQNKLSGGLIV